VRDDRVCLQHIRDALDDITTYCGSVREAFMNGRMRQGATLRKFEIMDRPYHLGRDGLRRASMSHS
jgi:uncharacterized protein with HEPN domain